jgi:hypothetical protein
MSAALCLPLHVLILSSFLWFLLLILLPLVIVQKKTAFHGVALVDRRWQRNGGARRRLVQVNAKTAGASKNIEVEVDKPLGLALGQKPGGGVIITVSTTSRPPLPSLRLLLPTFIEEYI